MARTVAGVIVVCSCMRDDDAASRLATRFLDKSCDRRPIAVLVDMTRTQLALMLLCSCADTPAGEPAADQDLEIAGDLPDSCKTADVIRIERPTWSDGTTADTFRYGFRFKPATGDAPVIVYLPGGPGQTSMDGPPMFVPDTWGYLMTDPRGVGCNRLASLPSADTSGLFFSTHEIANDVIAAIQDRALSHYILFGISYGTDLGTTVAHEIETRGVTAPDAVVLEGVLGRAFGTGDDDFAGAEYITQWERVRTVLPAGVIAELDTNPTPYGFDAVAWSKALMALLPRGPAWTASFIALLDASQPADTQKQVLDAIGEVASDPGLSPQANELYREVACREIMDTVPADDLDVVFQAGHLVRNRAEEGTKCRDLHVTSPYDSAALQFVTQLYLFVGDSDTATPPWQGAYHYDNHAGPVVRVTTKNGGHNSLEFNQADCAASLMASIAAGGADLATAAAGCPMPTTIDQK
jgi:pimeloyl-ACP methyl ester carboxylesterase